MSGSNHGVQFHFSQTLPSPSGMHEFGQSGPLQGWKLSCAGSLGCCADTQIHSCDCCGHLDPREEESFLASAVAQGTQCLVRLAGASPCMPWGTA